MAWFEEVLFVLTYSKRIQMLIWLGVISFLVLLVAGEYFASHFVLEGILAPMSDAVREILRGKYAKAAWASLGGCVFAAVKSYRKERKRLFSL